MEGVFISYRRSDSDVAAGRLADDLSEIFGHDMIFRDVDKLEPGEDYTKALDNALESCTVLLAIIGPGWSNITDKLGHCRIKDPNDWVHIEIKRALLRDIRVIPILISAEMPLEAHLSSDLKPLIQRQAFEINDRHWKQDIELLAQVLENIPGIIRRKSSQAQGKQNATRRHILTLTIILTLLTTAGWFGWIKWNSNAPAGPVDLSQWIRIRDQGREGSQGGLVVVTAMEARLAKQNRPVTLSARYIYEKAKRKGQYGVKDDGTEMEAALFVAESFGAPPEDRWPYIVHSRELPENVTWKDLDDAAARFRARVFRISAYNEIIQHLKQGHPVIASVVVTRQGWMNPETNRTGLIKFKNKKELTSPANHVVVIVGYDPSKALIKFANSWGVEWGDNGFGWILENDAKTILKSLWAIDVPVSKP